MSEKVETVWVAVPYYKSMETGTMDCLEQMINYENQKLQNGEFSGYTFRYIRKEGTNKSTVSRDEHIRNALDYGAEWILWIDSDMVFPQYTLEEMWNYRKKNGIVGAFCVWRKEPHFPTCGRLDENGFMIVNWFNRKMLGSGIHIQDGTGMGVTIVDTDIYRKMEPKKGDSPAMVKAVESVLKDADKLSVEEAINRIDDANGYWGWYLTENLSGTLKSYDGKEIRVKNHRVGNDYAFCMNAKRHHGANCYLLSTPRLPYVGHLGEETYTPHHWYNMLDASENKMTEMLKKLKDKKRWNIYIAAASDREPKPDMRPYWTDYWVQNSFINAFEDAGHKVYTINSPAVNPNTEIDLFINLFGVENPAHPDILSILLIHSNPNKITRNYISRYTKMYCTSAKFADIVNQWKGPHCETLIYGSRMHEYTDYDAKTIVGDEGYPDVIYVGNDTRRRPMLEFFFDHIEEFEELKYRFKLYGIGWDEAFKEAPQYIGAKFVSHYHLRDLYASTKIALVDHAEDSKRYGLMNPKVFDVYASKGFPIVDDIQYMDDVFGDVLVRAKDADDLHEKVKYYLTHEEERKQNIEKGHAIAMKYTYEKAVKRIIDDIKAEIASRF